MLNVIDEFTRECLRIDVARRINAHKVRQVVSDLIDMHGPPEHIRSDNRSEFIAGQLQEWLKDNEIDTLYIAPGIPRKSPEARGRTVTPRASTPGYAKRV